ncbi:MAG: hypothetical protein ACON35_01275 [Candidatus Marinamargulisbacteria bacterium]
MKRLLWGILVIFTMAVTTPLSAIPIEELMLETIITVNSGDKQRFLVGQIDVTFDLITPTDNVVFTKSFTAAVSEGRLQIFITEDDNFTSQVFNQDILRARLTLAEKNVQFTNNGPSVTASNANLGEGEVIILPFHAFSKAVYTNTATSTMGILNDDLASFNNTDLTVAIATSNHLSRLHVDGTVRGNAFIGNGSQLTNLNYIRWRTIYERIYYDEGFVGINTNEPKALLHVSGNMLVTQNIIKETPVLLTIKSALVATFNGGAQQITNFNASNVSQGTLAGQQLFGSYPGMTGVGTIKTGLWNASLIQDGGISNQISVRPISITNGSLSGQVTLGQTLSVDSHSNLYPVIIDTQNWRMADQSKFSSIGVSTNRITKTHLEMGPTLNILQQSIPTIIMNSSGNVGIATNNIPTELSIDGAIQLGNTSTKVPGTMRLGTYFEAYSSDDGWQRLDQLGNFTGTSLFAENSLDDPLILIDVNGNIGFQKERPKDNLVVSGNVIFSGNSQAASLSSSVSDGVFFIWAAKQGALRIGDTGTGSYQSDMNISNHIGDYSVGIGHQAVAKGIGSIVITSPTTNYTSINSGDYAVNLGSRSTNISGEASQTIASYISEISGTGNIAVSSKFSGNLSQNNNTFLSASIVSQKYSNSIVGGLNASGSLGHRSFAWDVSNTGRFYPSAHHDDSFFIGFGTKVGINTNAPSTSLDVNGTVTANQFEGNGSLLTGDIRTSFMKTGGLSQNIPATINVKPYHIYASDSDGYMILSSIDSLSITNNSIESDDIKDFDLDTQKFKTGSIINENFANGSVQSNHLINDSLGESKFSNVTGDDIEPDSIDEFKLAINSIYTNQLADQAVTPKHIADDTINHPSNNIALHAVTSKDIVVEQLNSTYFAPGAATGRTIAEQAIFTTTDNAGIDESYIKWKESTGEAAPQIKEKHINTGAVSSTHIPLNELYSRHFGDQSIHSADVTTNQTADIITNQMTKVANTRTLPEPVFIGRHFADDGVSRSKFDDDCQSCQSPTENFQIQTNQIADGAIRTQTKVGEVPEIFFGIPTGKMLPIFKYHNHFDNGVIKLEHIKDKNIIGRHITNLSIKGNKFVGNTVVSQNISVDAVTSKNIVNNTIVPTDFSDGSIGGEQITSRSVTSREIGERAFASADIGVEVIKSVHIQDKTLSSNDFAPGAFTEDKIKNGTIGGNLIKDGQIDAKHVSKNTIIDAEKFMDSGLDWADFEGMFPNDRFGENQIDFDSKFKSNVEFDGSKLATASVTKTKFSPKDNFTFKLEKLKSPLMVPKGGTGMTEFALDRILTVVNDDGDVKMNQSNRLKWKSTNNSNYLQIGAPTQTNSNGFNGVITSGDVLIESGALILKDEGNNKYTFFKYNTNDSAIQLTGKSALTETDTNMDLKAKDVYVKSSLVIGNGNATNGIDLGQGFILGKTYLDNNESLITNGLMIEGSLQIGSPKENIISTASDIGDDRLQVNGTIQGTSTGTGVNSPGILADISGLTGNDYDSPIKTNMRTIAASAPIGIESSGKNPMTIAMNPTAESTGMHLITTGAAAPAAAAKVEIETADNSISLESFFGKIEAGFKAAIYGKSTATTKANNYAGIFTGAFNASHLSDNEQTPTNNLQIDSLKVDGPVVFKTQEDIGTNIINWKNGNVANLIINNNNRNITFIAPESSAKLFILIKHTGTGRLNFNVPNLIWMMGSDATKGYKPDFSAVDGGVDMVMITYDETMDKFIAGAAFNFSVPD